MSSSHTSDSPSHRPCCLHIGLPKTATKTLQGNLFTKHPEVDYLGIYSNDAGNEHYRTDVPGVRVKNAKINELLDHLLWEGKFKPDFERCRELYAQTVAASIKSNAVPVWSWESMVEDTHKVQAIRARNLKEIFGSCKVLVTIRHPLDFVESLYLQLLYRDNLGSHASTRNGLVYEPMEKWLETRWNDAGQPPKAHLEYAAAIKNFADVFGNDSVKVLLFEELKKDPNQYLKDVCEFVGIDAEVGVRLAEQKTFNARWRQTGYDEFLRISQSPWARLKFKFASKEGRKQMLGMTDAGRNNPTGKGAKIDLSDEWKQRILDKTREGNRWLAETWDLPLGKYDYPL